MLHLGIFSDLELMEVFVVIYICQVCKLYILLWICLELWAILETFAVTRDMSFFGKRSKFLRCTSCEVYFFLALQQLDNSWGFLDTAVALF